MFRSIQVLLALAGTAACFAVFASVPSPAMPDTAPGATVSADRPVDTPTSVPTEFEEFDRQARLAMLRQSLEGTPDLGANLAVCFAPDTPAEYIAAFCAEFPELCPGADPRYQFSDANRWPGGQGAPTALTWSFVPDGTGGSTLFASMDAKFGGNRALWVSKIQACFNRWQQLTGADYTRITVGGNDWDDGAAWGSSGSATRGDVRIRAINIDGSGGVLAYNEYPPTGGDMTLDSSESWQASTGDYRLLRNVVMHEHGHGLGIAHVCPAFGGANGRLMEPFINTTIDGPVHDDIRAGQRGYGDPYENNNNAAGASDLGTLVFGTPVQIGPTPAPVISNGSVLSVDANAEEDWFRFTVATPAEVTVTVTPKGFTYDSSPQNGDGSCQSGNNVNSLAIANLNVQVIGTDGTTVLATGASQPSGSAETLSSIPLSGSPGTFYIKVYEGDSPSQSQLYWFDISIFDTSADITPPTPNPAEWSTLPEPASTTSITMTEALATDPSGVEYRFYSGTGTAYSSWQAGQTFLRNGLTANAISSYKCKSRDASPQHNETGFSDPVWWTATAIETPAGISFANVTDTTMDVTALGSFTNLSFNESGLYFEMTPDVPGSGANVWTAGTTSTTVSLTGLSPGTTYTFRVKARNYYGSRGGAYETAWVGPVDQQTTGGGAGACCYPDGSCTDEPDQATCTGLGGVWQGGGTECITANCPVLPGACCYPDGSCTDEPDEATCTGLGGTWQGYGTACLTANCPVLPGACCYPDGSCTDEPDQTTCTGLGGTWQGYGTACLTANCPVLPGACCFSDGSCVDEPDEATCTGFGGAWQGYGTQCLTTNCPILTGACCLPDGTCYDLPDELVCTLEAGGAWQGTGTTCATANCPILPGACCYQNGSCTDEPDEATCTGLGGTWQGYGTQCLTANCPVGCALLGDVNDDGVVNGQDIDGFLRAKLGLPPAPGENQACANYGGPTLQDDINAFIADLL